MREAPSFYDDGFLLGHGRWRQHERRKPEVPHRPAAFGVHEIMMHPGRSTAVLSQSFSWEYHWQDEFQALMSPAIRRQLEKREIQLITYGDLP